jgi:hypothetical protein
MESRPPLDLPSIPALGAGIEPRRPRTTADFEIASAPSAPAIAMKAGECTERPRATALDEEEEPPQPVWLLLLCAKGERVGGPGPRWTRTDAFADHTGLAAARKLATAPSSTRRRRG